MRPDGSAADRPGLYLDLTGSGNETAAHALADGRLTLMFCAFEGPPLILRLYGRSRILRRGGPEYTRLLASDFGGVEPLGARQMVLPQGEAEVGQEEERAVLAARVESTKERTPGLDGAGLLRRTFALDVFACAGCGGSRRVLASDGPRIALAACWGGPGAGATPERVELSPKHPQCPGSPRPCGLPPGWAAWAGVCPEGRHGLCSDPAHSPRVTLQRPFSTPLLQPAPSNRAPIPPRVFPTLRTAGLGLAYGLYTAAAVASLFFVLFFIRETKSKELEEM